MIVQDVHSCVSVCGCTHDRGCMLVGSVAMAALCVLY